MLYNLPVSTPKPKPLPSQLQEYVHKSRYARWLDDKQRRETWGETVQRYVDYFSNKFEGFPKDEIQKAITQLDVMPSMRAMMTAGPALERDPIAGYNCSFTAIDDIRAFDEILYISMCFHPDTGVVTREGTKAIKDVVIGDEILSIDTTGEATWQSVTNQVKTPSAQRPKVLVTLDNGHTVKCTADHKWLTTNRGWVEAAELTTEDDLTTPGWQIYQITNTANGKVYIGQTSKDVITRFKEHQYTAKTQDSNWHFAKAIRKHPESVWEIKVIDFAFSEAEAHLKECQWIAKLDSAVSGYNSTTGGEGAPGYKWTDEQRKHRAENMPEWSQEQRDAQRQVLAKAQEKIVATRQTQEYRDAQRIRNLGENNPMFGKEYSEEQRAKISARVSGENNPFFGKTHSTESKQKMRDSQKDNNGTANPFFGKKHTDATRTKMREAWAKKSALKGATA